MSRSPIGRLRARAAISLFGLLLATVGIAATAPPAQATPPGPNGRIAFSAFVGRFQQLFTMKSDGSDVQQVTHLADHHFALGSNWSPDGSKLVFSEGHQAVLQISVINANGTDLHKLFSDPWYLDFIPAYSPDGSTIVFARCTPDFEGCAIATVNADGTGGVTDLTDFSSFRFEPVYSPDGSRIAFSGFGMGGVSSAVWVMNADGSHPHRITGASLSARVSDWSPDGARILFWSHCCTPKIAQVWTIAADGSDAVQLTHPFPQHDFAGTYSPNGKRIVFERHAADFSKVAVWVMSTDGTGVHSIHDGGFDPRWGPATNP